MQNSNRPSQGLDSIALYTHLTRLPFKQLEEIIFLYGLDERFLAKNPTKVDLAKNLIQYAESQNNLPTLEKLVKQVAIPAQRQQPFFLWFALFMFLIVIFSSFYVWCWSPPGFQTALKDAELSLDLGEYEQAKKRYEILTKRAICNAIAQAGLRKATILHSIYSNDEFEPTRVQKQLESLADDPHGLTVLANFFKRSGKFNQAVQHYRDALALRNSLTAAHFGLGTVLMFQGDYATAQQHLQQAVDGASSHPKYRDNLGTLYLLQGNYVKALEQYKQALHDDTNFLLFYQEIAIVMWRQGKIKLALMWLQKLEKYLNNGKLLKMEKNTDAWAFILDNQWIGLNTWIEKRAYLFTSMAAACFLLDRKEEAQRYFNRAWELSENIEIHSDIQSTVRALVAQDVRLATQAKPKQYVAASHLLKLLTVEFEY